MISKNLVKTCIVSLDTEESQQAYDWKDDLPDEGSFCVGDELENRARTAKAPFVIRKVADECVFAAVIAKSDSVVFLYEARDSAAIARYYWLHKPDVAECVFPDFLYDDMRRAGRFISPPDFEIGTKWAICKAKDGGLRARFDLAPPGHIDRDVRLYIERHKVATQGGRAKNRRESDGGIFAAALRPIFGEAEEMTR